MSKQLISSLSIIIFTVLVLLISVYWFFENSFGDVSRASLSVVNRESSYVFVSPFCADISSGGKQRVTVFCLDSNGRGIPNIQVFLNNTDPTVKVEVLQGETDSQGKAIFDISSQIPKNFQMRVNCSQIQIESVANVCFR